MGLFNQYFIDTIKNRYAQFDGRASRSEFWYFNLFYIIITIVLMGLGALLGSISTTLALIPTGIVFILALALIVPSIALTVRRLHDSDKVGWFVLVAFIPFVGSIILIILMCLDSTAGSNQFGPNPHDGSTVSGSQSFNDIIDR